MSNTHQETFAHERLDAYRVAREFLVISHELSRQLPRTKGQLGDQLARAAEGILLCIAEGSGVAWHSQEQKRFFRAARGSATECAAILDICEIRSVGRAEHLTEGRLLLIRLVKMLTKLCR